MGKNKNEMKRRKKKKQHLENRHPTIGFEL